MVNVCAYPRSSYSRKSFFILYMTLHPIPSEFPYLWGKFCFLCVPVCILWKLWCMQKYPLAGYTCEVLRPQIPPSSPFNDWVAGWAEGDGAEVVPELLDGAHLPADSPFNNWVAGWAEGDGAEVVPELPDGAHLPVDPALPAPGSRGHARQNRPRFRDQQGNPAPSFYAENLSFKGTVSREWIWLLMTSMVTITVGSALFALENHWRT